MALRGIGGGDKGTPLRTTCTVESHLVTRGPAVGQFVELTLSGNWTVNEHGTGVGATVTGVIRSLHDDNSIATVEWLTFNKVYNVAYSGTATLGQAIKTAASHTEKLLTSANATQALFAQCVAKDVPSSGYMDIITV